MHLTDFRNAREQAQHICRILKLKTDQAPQERNRLRKMSLLRSFSFGWDGATILLNRLFSELTS